MKILIATQNQGKVKEYRRLFADVGITFVGLDEIGLSDMDVEETGTTFEENAEIKAKSYADASDLWVIADDSGLMVDALDGAPGVYSARYGGADLDFHGKRQKMLGELQDVPQSERGAKFVCVIAIAKPNTDSITLVRGECNGQITVEEFDEGKGFGYDPIFLPDGHELTFGQMSADLKNNISHRAIAAEKALPILKQMIEDTL